MLPPERAGAGDIGVIRPRASSAGGAGHANAILHVHDASDRDGDILDSVLHPALGHRALDGDDSVWHRDGDIARIQMRRVQERARIADVSVGAAWGAKGVANWRVVARHATMAGSAYVISSFIDVYGNLPYSSHHFRS